MNNSGTLVDRRLEAGQADKVAVRCAGESVTYGQVHDRIQRVGNVLEGLGVGRVIARPFVGAPGQFKRTANRRDFALPPKGETLFNSEAVQALDLACPLFCI